MMKMEKIGFMIVTLLMLWHVPLSETTITAGECGGHRFVDDSFVIDFASCSPLSVNADGHFYWQFTTKEDRIIAFSADSLAQFEPFLDIYDGAEAEESKLILLKNQVTMEKSRKDLPPTVYSTSNSATVRVRYNKLTPTSLKIKISKAVNCPYNIGLESQCGRAYDEVSCYCATFTNRKWQDQQSFCNNYAMYLFTIESLDEEQAIQRVWITASGVKFWMGLTDLPTEGLWRWDGTRKNLYPSDGGLGYANWDRGEPNNKNEEDCGEIHLISNGNTGWNDWSCSNNINAICESQP